jgi:hypothetical protein
VLYNRKSNSLRSRSVIGRRGGVVRFWEGVVRFRWVRLLGLVSLLQSLLAIPRGERIQLKEV